MRLKNILLVVKNIEQSKAFYQNLFGLKVITDFGGNVILTEGLVLQEQEIWETFVERSVDFGGNDAELYFEENDMDGFLEKLKSSGWVINYVNEMMEHDWGQRVIRIYDPDKHIIEIGESMEYVVRRFWNQGMSMEQVAEKTQLSLPQVKAICRETFVFAPAKEEDLPDILVLYRAAIGMEGCTWSLEYPNAEILQEDFRRGNLFCMKKQDDEIVGVVSIDVDEAVAALPCWAKERRPAAELARLTVKKAYQNQGIARLLLREAIRELVRRGCHGVHFLVSKTNEKAIRSYSKLNFEVRGDCQLYDTDWWCYEKGLDSSGMECMEDAI